MALLTDFIVNFGNVVELKFPSWDLSRANNVLDKHPGWKTYQPHKPGYNRMGLSVTSLDGGFSGEPDLYSLMEYAKITGEHHSELDFKTRTNVCSFIPELEAMLNAFGPDLGRTHFIKLGKGGFFPPHRDNGLMVQVPTYRILVPITGFGINDSKFMLNEQIGYLTPGATYFVNTTLIHSLFSFVENCTILVVNVAATDDSINKLVKYVNTV